MRKLATIRKISLLSPIIGADSIECAHVDGWKVVVKKNEFSIDQLVVYFEIDSWIPHSLAPFLTKEGQSPKTYNDIQGQRLRTVKLRGQISQGLILPVSCIIYMEGDYGVEGDDVTNMLSVVKYDPPVPAELAGVVKGPWPSLLPKTDEERVQNLSREISEDYSNMIFEITEKLEGASMSVGWVSDEEFVVCSRNLNLLETESNSLWKIARKYNCRELVPKGIVLQGEIIGESIQGNYYDLKGQEFYVFSAYNVNKGEYLLPDERVELCKKIRVNRVPLQSTVFAVNNKSVDDLLSIANGRSTINHSKKREGVVFKQIDGQTHFKAVSNEYLLKEY